MMGIFDKKKKVNLKTNRRKYKEGIVYLHYSFLNDKLGLVSKHKNGEKKYLVKIKDLKKI